MCGIFSILMAFSGIFLSRGALLTNCGVTICCMPSYAGHYFSEVLLHISDIYQVVIFVTDTRARRHLESQLCLHLSDCIFITYYRSRTHLV